jgi:hypothetical protein
MPFRYTHLMQYQPPHQVIRAQKIKAIWIKEHEREQRRRISFIVPRVISFSIGYLVGTQGRGWSLWISSVIVYFALFYFLKYVAETYKINWL